MFRTVLVLALVAAVCGLSRWEQPAITQDLVDEINNAHAGWTAGWNEKFMTANLGDVRSLCGTIPTPASFKEKQEVVETVAAVPDTFDSRTNWPACTSIGHIRDQSACGSCWAFGAVEAFEDRWCIASNGAFNSLLSTQDMTSCCDSCGFGCQGGFLAGAWQYFVTDGVVTGGDYGDKGSCYPYVLPPCDHHVNGTLPPCGNIGPTPDCVQKCVNNADWAKDKHYASNAYTVRSVAGIQTEIMNYGPVEASFTVYNDFLTYKSGVYRHVSGSNVGGHAIKIIGWGVENGQNYWLVANSWNTEWGDHGWFKILRGSNECGIENDVHGGHVRL